MVYINCSGITVRIFRVNGVLLEAQMLFKLYLEIEKSLKSQTKTTNFLYCKLLKYPTHYLGGWQHLMVLLPFITMERTNKVSCLLSC